MYCLNRLIHIKCRPHHIVCIPAGCALTAAIGEGIVFSIQFYANPDPDVSEWNWTFVPANQDIHAAADNKPSDVSLTVGNGFVFLVVVEVTSDHAGNYKEYSRNAYGQDQTTLQLGIEGNHGRYRYIGGVKTPNNHTLCYSVLILSKQLPCQITHNIHC